MMDASFVTWLASVGGVAHTSTARRAGFSPHRIARSVDAGVVARVRRSWLLAAGCDPHRARAAVVGGRVTCVSAARALGLWVPASPDADRVHVAIAPTDSRLDDADLVLHRATAPIALPRTRTDEHPINMLFHVARCLDPADALAVWESAIRVRAVTAAALAAVQWRSTAARELASLASSLSDSGIETRFIVLLRTLGVPFRQQVSIAGHAVDTLIGERIIAQLDGFAHHSSAADRRRDIAHDARLTLMGYTVFRFDYRQVFFESEWIVDTLLTAIAQQRHQSA
ncbi:DUF559 domain-containing protein [uncultured Microbacterium sp.]|jgi:very-short-patch-repair endonuclease|uniref:endonuclease domain-containing protein n=1 Tax=uncultured Microbacterium sp. TaxID=191216 RepID=UPI0025CD2A5D|nr:DUF559 domain-containing protein [uncultured Microbacterium sp.]